MSRADPARLLLRALRRSALQAGCTIAPVHEGEVPWASATFVGAQHRVRVTGADDAWLAAVSDADLPIRDHLVASCAVEWRGATAILTVLVLEA